MEYRSIPPRETFVELSDNSPNIELLVLPKPVRNSGYREYTEEIAPLIGKAVARDAVVEVQGREEKDYDPTQGFGNLRSTHSVILLRKCVAGPDGIKAGGESVYTIGGVSPLAKSRRRKIIPPRRGGRRREESPDVVAMRIVTNAPTRLMCFSLLP